MNYTSRDQHMRNRAIATTKESLRPVCKESRHKQTPETARKIY